MLFLSKLHLWQNLITHLSQPIERDKIMRKKIVRIILIVIGAFAIGFAGFGIYIYNFTQKSERITGRKESVPLKNTTLEILTKGSSDWGSWQGENFDKKSTFTGIVKDWSKGLKKVWEVNYLCQGKQSATWSAPVVQGNVLIVPGRDDTNDLIFCLNSSTGEFFWKGLYEAKTKDNHGPGARATPVIDNDRAYSYGRGGDLVCWDLHDGKILWHKKAADLGGIEPDWGYSSSPLLIGNKVIIQAGGKVLATAYDKITGDLLWTSGKGAGGYSPLNVFTADSSLLLLSGDALSGINRETGTVTWSLPWIVEYKINATTPLSEGNIVFVTSGYKKGSMAVKIERNKPEVLWQSNALEGQQTDPVILKGYIYGYSGNSSSNRGELVCLRLTDGKVMWKTSGAGMGTLAYADGYLVCLDIKGNLYLVEANPDKFVKAGEFKKAIPDVKHPAWTAPVIANGKLYLRYLQSIVCYDINSGSY
jgi:outer membrane protein assembly factor BamB